MMATKQAGIYFLTPHDLRRAGINCLVFTYHNVLRAVSDVPDDPFPFLIGKVSALQFPLAISSAAGSGVA
jgi:hypothetical protein